jgi:hypothetical protein
MDFAKALDQGMSPPREDSFLPNYRQLRHAWDASKPSGRPILVAEVLTGPIYIVEGYSRLSVRASRAIRNQEELPVDVVIGICAGLPEWYLDDNQHGLKLC